MRGRALLLATSRYDDPQLSQLESTIADVAGLRAVLADPAIGDFEVDKCVDESNQVWRERVEEFFSKAVKDELLLLYVSGHGVKDRDGRLYFAAADTKLDRLKSTGVPAGFIQDASSDSRSRRQVMIFDTCFSGAFAKGVTLKSGKSKVDSGQYFSEGGGKIVITASDEMQYALSGDTVSGEPVPSAFTKRLIEGLETGQADSDNDGRITADDLFHYVADAVRQDTPTQRAQQWAFGLSGDIVLATNPNPRPADLQAELQLLVDHPFPEARQKAIEQLSKLASGPNPAMALAARGKLEQLSADDSRMVSAAAQSALQALGEPKVPSVTGAAPARAKPAREPARPAPKPAKPPRERSEPVPRAQEHVEFAEVAVPGSITVPVVSGGRIVVLRRVTILAGLFLLVAGLLPFLSYGTDFIAHIAMLHLAIAAGGAWLAAGRLFIGVPFLSRSAPLGLALAAIGVIGLAASDIRVDFLELLAIGVAVGGAALWFGRTPANPKP